MASINSLMSSTSSTSSIYGNSNIISGLASGMDTEAMIENAVSGIKNKIAGFNQDMTVFEWEQNAYRDLIGKMTDFSTKYMSFSSNTNLLSSAFFDSATKITVPDKYSDLISATGKPNSAVQIVSAKLATAATKTCSLGGGSGDTTAIVSNALNLEAPVKTSNVSGSLTLACGTSSVELKFDDTVYNTMDDFVAAINQQITDAGLTNVVKAEKAGDGFKFTNTDGKAVKITAASGSLKNTLGIETGDADIAGKTYTGTLVDEAGTTVLGNMIGKEFSFTVDGVTKTITLTEDDAKKIDDKKTSENPQKAQLEELATVLKDKISDAFGEGKVSVSATDDDKLSFAIQSDKASTMKITGAEELGIGSTATNYTNMTKKLSELGLDIPTQKNDKGEDEYKFTLNNETITFGKDATLSDVVKAINANEKMGVTVSFSELTNQFQFTSKETGEGAKIETGTGENNLAVKLFGEINKQGTDAKVKVKVNGETGARELHPSDNTFELDGMTISLKGDIDGSEPVTFTAGADTDKIVNAIKSFVEDYNNMANAIKDAYTTKPLTASSGGRYKPLTEEDMKDMSDEAVKRYEEKAKTGLLFADSNLSSLYSELRYAISDRDDNGDRHLDLEAIGIKTAYSNGKTTLVLDEEKLRTAVETDMEKVKDAFTREPDPTDEKDPGGLMVRLQTTVDKYARTTGATKGVLIELAGSEKSPASISNNVYKGKMDRLQEQIDRWQNKLVDKVDYYTRQFTALEKLISQMNSQSSSLAGMMGY